MILKHNDKTFDVSVFYDKGGMNFFSGSTIQRGYHFHIQPVVDTGDSYMYVPTEGKRGLVEPVSRYNAKRQTYWTTRCNVERATKLVEEFENKTLTLERAREILNT